MPKPFEQSTNVLRFVEREVPAIRETVTGSDRRTARVLQQWWKWYEPHPINPGQGEVEKGEWRDVPLEIE